MTLLLAASACSPGMFGDAKDKALATAKNYRKANIQCAGLDLSKADMSVKSFRGLVDCLNADGALGEITDLVDSLSDEELKPIVDLSNKYVMTNKDNLFQIETTFHELEAKQSGDKTLLDDSLNQLGRLLENDELLAAAVSMAKDTYFCKDPNAGPDCRNDKLLKAVERLSEKFDTGTITTAMDVMLTLGRTRVFKSLLSHFAETQILDTRPAGTPERESLRELTHELITYLQYVKQDPQNRDHLRDLLQATIDGKLLPTLDDVVGTTPEEFVGGADLHTGVSRTTSMLKETLQYGGGLMDRTLSLFHYADQGISCMRGTRFIPNAAKHVLKEISLRDYTEAATFMKRDNVLKLIVANPVCDLPPQLQQYYSAIWDLADTAAAEPTAQLMTSFYNHGLADLLVSVLSDTGPDNNSGLKLLIPTLAELTDRGIWDDFILAVNLPTLADRAKIVDTLKWVMDSSDPRMTGSSLYDVALDLAANTDPDKLHDVIYAMRSWVDPKQPDLLVPALKTLRSAYYLNDAHPVVNITHDIMAHASENKALFDTLFTIADNPHFRPAIQHLSKMAEDGSLRDILEKLLQLFDKWSKEGQTQQIHDVVEPAVKIQLRHNLDESMIFNFSPNSAEPSNSNESCHALDFNVSLAEPGAPGFENQIQNLMGCINSDGYHGDVVDIGQFLFNLKTNENPPRSFIAYQIDLMKTFFNGSADPTVYPGLSNDEIYDVTDRWLRTMDDGRMERLLEAIRFYAPRPGDGLQDVLRPLFDLVGPIVGNLKAEFDRMQDFGAKYLGSEAWLDKVPYLIRYADKILDVKPKPPVGAKPSEYDVQRIMRWVGNKECVADPAQQYKRANEIIDDYDKGLTSWELLDDGQGHKHARRSWSFDEFHNDMVALFGKLGGDKLPDGESQNGEKSALRGMLNVLNYFTLKPGETPRKGTLFTVDDLIHFFYQLAHETKYTTYFYPGETKPRVRLMSGLDRLELVLTNADFMAPFPFNQNFGQKFLADIGMAWGDEDPSVWPDYVKAEYNRTGKWPLTLEQAIEGVESQEHTFELLLGYPKLPSCQQVANPNDPKNVQDYETSIPKAAGWLGKILPDGLRLPGANAAVNEPVPNASSVPSASDGMSGLTNDMLRGAIAAYRALHPNDDTGLPSDFDVDAALSEGKAPAPLTVLEQKQSIYNIRQVVSIVRELLPETDGYRGHPTPPDVKQKGMQILRVLFYEMYSSSNPDFITKKMGYGSKAGWGNNLSVVLKMVRMGITREIGRELRGFDENDPALHDLFGFLVDSTHVMLDEVDSHSKKPGTEVPPLFKALFQDPNDPQQQLVWTVLHKVWDTLDSVDGTHVDSLHAADLAGKSSSEQASIEDGWQMEPAFMKQLGFYVFGLMEKLGAVKSLVDSSTTLIENYRPYLLKHPDDLEDLMRNDTASYLVRALYEDLSREASGDRDNPSLCERPPNGVSCQQMLSDIVNDAMTGDGTHNVADDGLKILTTLADNPADRDAWHRFRTGFDALDSNSDYQALNMGQIKTQLLDFFEEGPDGDAKSYALGTKLRKYAAMQMTKQEIDQLLVLMSKNPDEFYRILSTVGHYGHNGEIIQFLQVLERAIVNPI